MPLDVIDEALEEIKKEPIDLLSLTRKGVQITYRIESVRQEMPLIVFTRNVPSWHNN